jgi:hypothetical protein
VSPEPWTSTGVVVKLLSNLETVANLRARQKGQIAEFLDLVSAAKLTLRRECTATFIQMNARLGEDLIAS